MHYGILKFKFTSKKVVSYHVSIISIVSYILSRPLLHHIDLI